MILSCTEHPYQKSSSMYLAFADFSAFQCLENKVFY